MVARAGSAYPRAHAADAACDPGDDPAWARADRLRVGDRQPHGLSAYCTGKIALNRLVAEAAAELEGTGVSVFAIDPGFVFTQLARATMESDDAARYLGDFVSRLRKAEHDPTNQDDLARCAQRCLDLASGRYDALSGNYYELPDDLDAELARQKEGTVA